MLQLIMLGLVYVSLPSLIGPSEMYVYVNCKVASGEWMFVVVS